MKPTTLNADEIVRALRNCKAYKTKSDLQTTMLMAADLIESLQAQLAESQRREKAAVEDLTKLATKSITPCHSCAKTCLFPASLAPEYQPPAWCREWQWRGRAGRGRSD